jgi:DNA-binding helix-hairpin-helix protein with protein kinase domain
MDYPVKQGLIIACVAAAVVSTCAAHQGRNELPSSSPRAADIQNALDQTVIPKVDLENVSLESALKTWHEASRDSHPQHFDFRYAISYPTTFSSEPARQGASVASASNTAKISVRRKNITSGRLLDEICQQAKFSWIIMGRVIEVRPQTATSGTQP